MSTSSKGFNPITTMSDTSEKASNNDSTKKRSASVLSLQMDLHPVPFVQVKIQYQKSTTANSFIISNKPSLAQCAWHAKEKSLMETFSSMCQETA
jgi:hypothetical protein